MAGMRSHTIACILIVAAALAPVSGRAADLDIAPPSAPPAQPEPAPQAAPAAGTAFAPPDATCLEWTDACRTCQKSPAGETSCSNVAIACVQQAPRCTRR
jgi:hypothetical protein